MDPSNPAVQLPGEGKQVGFLPVASPASVIVAAPAAAQHQGNASHASGPTAQLHISQSQSGQPAVLIPQTAAVGRTPLILGLISTTDAGNLGGSVSTATNETAAVLKLNSNPTLVAGVLQAADGAQFSLSSSSTQTLHASQAVLTSLSGESSTSKEGTMSSKTGTTPSQAERKTSTVSPAEQKASMTPPKSHKIVATPPSGHKTGMTPPSGQRTGMTPPSGQRTGMTPPSGQRTGMTPPSGQKTGTTPPSGHKAGTTPPGAHGTGKPKSFAVLMAGEGVPLSKKQAMPAKKAQISKGSSSKSKSKVTPTNSPSSTSVPTRSSHRTVKRPRTYDEDVVELEMQMQKATKKTKGMARGGTSKSALKRSNRPQISVAMKDLGRWRPTDDLMLISAVQQTNDLAAVHLGVKFSCRFTLREVEERWYALLYDPQISKLAVEAMRSLHPGVVTMALNNALWSSEEEDTLAKIPSTDPGHLETFQALLRDNPCVFHACRTATSLHHHWVLMGHYTLLNNQKVDLIPPGEAVGSFGDAEDQLNDSELQRSQDVKEAALEQELVAIDRHAKREIMRLEEELPNWRTIIDTGSTPEFGADEYAILKGKVVEFQMTTHAVTLGRNTTSSQVDFDLSLEAPAFKISRKQATIHVSSDGDFVIRNEGRRPLYLDGKALVSGKSTKLQHNQVLEVASMSFLVLLNTKLAASVSAAS